MTDDVAKLGLEIESKGLEQGTDKLKEFSETAKAAGNAADDFNEKASSGADKTGKAHAESAEKIATSSAKAAASVAKEAGAFDAVKTAAAGMTDAQLGAAVVVGALGTAAVAAAASVGVLAYNWLDAQQKIGQSLIGVGERSGATVAKINEISQASSATFGLSVTQARDIATEFAKTGNVGVESIEGLTKATQGFAILTGKDTTAAAKDLARIMGGDLVSAANQLNQTYGTLDGKTIEYIRTLQNQGEKQKAIQIILDNIEPTNQRAAASLGILEQAWDAVANAVDRAKNSIGQTLIPPPVPLETQRADLQGKRDRIANDPGNAAQQFVGGIINSITGGDTKSAALSAIDEQIKVVDADLAKLAANQADLVFIKMAQGADAATKAMIPQIGQIQTLEAELAKLEAARANADVAGRQGNADQNNAAIIAIENLIAKTQEAQAETARYNERVQEISQQLVLVDGEWVKVGQSTALSLQAAQNQLPVLQAIGGAAKMAAQEAADYANAMDRGKTATEAAALASSNLEAAQARASSAIQAQTQQLADSNRLQQAGFVSQYAGTQKLSDLQYAKNQERAVADQKSIASQQAYNQVIKDGGTIAEANNRQYEVGLSFRNQEAAAADRVKQAQLAINDATAQWRAELLGVGAAAEVIGADYSKILQLQNQIDQATAQYNAQLAQQSEFISSMPSGQHTFTSDPSVHVSYKGGAGGIHLQPAGYTEALFKYLFPPISGTDLANKTLGQQDGGGVDAAIAAIQKAASLTKYGSPVTDATSSLQTLYGIKNQGADNATKITNDQQFINWLQSQPQSVDNLKAIGSLTEEIKSLAQSTDSLNATNSELLSPYYTQDPRTSHIGFRSQGMASGGYVDVPGSPSVNDNMIATIPVASGERIYVDPMPGKRGVGGGTTNFNIRIPVTINGNATKDDIGRTMYQVGQTMTRQLAAAGR